MNTAQRLSSCLVMAMPLPISIAPAHSAEPVRDVEYFLARLGTLDHLPELEESHAAMASTWDRTGSNIDGFDFKRVEPDGRNVLLDVGGPGCLHRIPFEKHCLVQLVNPNFRPDRKDHTMFDWKKQAIWGRFHATFTEERATGEPSPRLGPQKVPCKIVLERKARGKYIGALIHVDWPRRVGGAKGTG